MAEQPRSSVKRARYWRQHYEEWKKSGESKTAYCQRHRLKRETFYRWSGIFVKEQLAPEALSRPQISFRSVKVNEREPLWSPSATIRIRRGGTTLELPVSLPPEALSRWLSALHHLDA